MNRLKIIQNSEFRLDTRYGLADASWPFADKAAHKSLSGESYAMYFDHGPLEYCPRDQRSQDSGSPSDLISMQDHGFMVL